MVLAAGGADHILVILDEIVHLIGGHGVHIHAGGGGSSLDELIGALTAAAALAVHQRIGEGAHVAGGDPGLGIHDDGGIQAHVVVRFLDELLQPGLLDVVLELHTQRAVVPGVGQAAVNFRAGIYITSVLAEIYDHFQSLFAVLHGFSSKTG